MELWFGTGIHYALEKYYDPILQHDPVESFKTWYDVQWKGGLVSEEWLERTYDIHPHLTTECMCGIEPRGATKNGHKPNCPTVNNLFKINGLRDLLPNVEVVEEEFELHRDLGIGMLEFYKEWAPKNDDFVIVAAESTFSIPLGFEAVDMREDSPNYGQMLEVHARGKRDAVIYYPEQDKFRINDHKTAARIDEDEFIKLEKDQQISTYLWATTMEGLLYDLPWSGHTVDGALYTALRKKYPQPPTPTYQDKKTGEYRALSVDRQNEGTTAELFEAALKSNPAWQKWFVETPKAQEYYTWLCEAGDENFIVRRTVPRNMHEIRNHGIHIEQIAREMLNPDTAIYPNPTGNWLCTGCAFRSPCIAADDGSDWQGMLADGYEQNRDR
jgi:hypothetical protein